MARSSNWTRGLVLVVIALLALGNIAARPQATSLRGRVFNDANGNGKYDEGEAGLVDFRVQVSTPDLGFVQEYRSGNDGTFGPVVSQGTFTVRILPPEGWSVTTPASYTVFVEQGTAVLGLDFGLVQGAVTARPAGSTTGSGSTSPGTLPTSGGEHSAEANGDLWALLGLWLIVFGAAFVAVTALAPRAQRK
ncbi:MAG TPA: SdrD B-like domain-containing protein [Anaerolineae bacterium]